MDELLKVPNSVGDKTPQLWAVYDKIGINACGLEALGIRSEQYGSFLIPIIMSELPGEVRLQIAIVTTKDVWDVNELSHVIKDEVEACELSDTVKVHDWRGQETPTRRTVFPSTATFFVTGDLPHKIQCVYCRANHYSAACDKLTTCQSRQDILLREGRCFLCLLVGHCASQYSTSRRCRQCKGRHHQSTCDHHCTVGNSADNKQCKNTENTRNSGDNKQWENTESTTTSVVRTKAKVLLQTARAQAYTLNRELIPVCLLLDSGSQRSYITSQLIQRLQLLLYIANE